MKVPGSNRVVSISPAVPLERPSDSTFSISQNYPGLCGRWAHKPGVGEAGTAVARLHCLLGAKSSRFGVKGGHMSPNVVQCRPMSPYIFFSKGGVPRRNWRYFGRNRGRIWQLESHDSYRVADIPDICFFGANWIGPVGQLLHVVDNVAQFRLICSESGRNWVARRLPCWFSCHCRRMARRTSPGPCH